MERLLSVRRPLRDGTLGFSTNRVTGIRVDIGMLRHFEGLVLTFCSAYDEEVKQKQIKGEWRKSCPEKYHYIDPIRRVNTTSRLARLRSLMQSEIVLRTLPIQAYIVTSSDEHQSLEVDEYDRRREFISGFSGSYGDVIITMDKAALWTDGRYYLQADDQLNCDWLLFRESQLQIPTRSQWLKQQLPNGGRIGMDPKLVSEFTWNKFELELKGSGLELVPLTNINLIDEIWPPEERGSRRSSDAFVLDLKFTGRNYTSKIEETRKLIKKAGASAMVITALDEIAWLLNIRGRDTPYSPFVRSYVILDMDNIFLYVNESQLIRNKLLETLHAESKFQSHFAIQVRRYLDIWADLGTMSQLHQKILVPSHCGYSEGASHDIYEHIFRDRRLPKQSPIIFQKAIKNAVEIANMKIAHIKDAAAMCDRFAYIEKEFNSGRNFTEFDIASIIDDYRYQLNNSTSNNFRTIVAFGPNAAHPSYEPTNETNAVILGNNLVILDSKGQYFDGTTDITRTLHFGNPTEEMNDAYTRVLMGTIQFSNLTFPNNMKMADADVLTRAPLWEVGLDYLHESGHGVGAFLGVRESPISVQYDLDISTKLAFKPGYFLSNEPGYYKEGHYGVRLENVMEVVIKPWLRHTSGHTFLGFQVITLVPFETKLMKLSLLSLHQRKWLNEYNKQIRILVGEELKSQNRTEGFYWMMDKTKYIPEYGYGNMISSRPILLLFSIIVLITNMFFII